MKRTTILLNEVLIIFVIGIAIHLFLLSNPLFNYDNIAIINGYGTGITSGRWALTFLGDFWGKIWGGWNLNYFNNVVFLFLMSIVSILILEIFEIKTHVLKLVWGGIFLSFPAMGSTLLFSYTTIYYGISILLSVIGVYFLTKDKCVFIAPFCFAVSLGIYQTYFSISITLLLIYVIFDIFNDDLKKTIFKAFKFLIATIMGLILYFAFLGIFLEIYNTSLSNYRGIDTMGQYTVTSFVGLIIKAYQVFFELPIRDYHCINASGIIRFCILIVEIFTVLFLMYEGIKKKKNAGFMLLILCIMLFPVAVNSIIVMSKDSVNNMMLMATVLIFLFPVIIIDRLDIYTVKLKQAQWIKHIVLVLLVVVTVRYAYIDNLNYNNLYFINKQLDSYVVDLINRIRSSDGYKEGMKVAFVGNKFIDSTFVNMWSDIPYKFDEYYYNLINVYSRDDFIRRYTGFSWEEVDEEMLKSLIGKKEVKNMQCYPDDGSIKVIDDIVVVKLEEE